MIAWRIPSSCAVKNVPPVQTITHPYARAVKVPPFPFPVQLTVV